MPILNGKYWEERYQASDMPWDKGDASPGLVDFLAAHPELKRGTVCVPGCGMGHDVRAWASGGVHAGGFDIAPSALPRAKEWTAAPGLESPVLLDGLLHDEPPVLLGRVVQHTT